MDQVIHQLIIMNQIIMDQTVEIQAQIIVAAVTQEVAMEALQVEIHQDQLVGLHQMLLKFIQ